VTGHADGATGVISRMKTQQAQIQETLGTEIAFTRLLIAFGAFALFLACIGLHGVTAYSVARRTSEIGVRIALGAQRGDVLWLVLRQVVTMTAAGLALGIPLQGVIGGIAVLTRLNPYVVGLHFLLSMVLIALAVLLVRMTWHLAAVTATTLSVITTRVTFGLMWLAVWLGTLVTGSGPHAGDENAPRNALDGMLLTRLHTSVVYATVAASVICFVLLRSRAVVLLLLVELVQVGIGMAQYQMGLPIWLVALHLLGASLAIATVTNLMLSVARRSMSRTS